MESEKHTVIGIDDQLHGLETQNAAPCLKIDWLWNESQERIAGLDTSIDIVPSESAMASAIA